MNRHGWIWAFCGCCLIAWAILRTHTSDPGPSGEWVVRAYDVDDLLNPPESAPEPALYVRTLGRLVPPPPLGGQGGGGGTPPDPATIRFAQLTTLVERAVSPTSWQKGGTATHFGRQLIVVQTRANHRVIGELLDELRASCPRAVRIEALWAALDARQLAQLLGPDRTAGVPPTAPIDLPALERIPGAILYRAQGICHSGRWIDLRCGRARTAVLGASSEFSQDEVTATGHITPLLDGAAVRLRPMLRPDARSVMFEVRSEITRWPAATPEPPIEFPPPLGARTSAPLKLDRLNLAVQSIDTSTLVPTNTAVLIGGATDGDRTDGRQLFLILRATPQP
jgi:hypothetical protein